MSTINISDLYPAGSALSQQFTNSEDLLISLSEDEQGSIQGGWIGAVVGAVGLGVAVYAAFTSEKERVAHRKYILEGKIAGRGSYAA